MTVQVQSGVVTVNANADNDVIVVEAIGSDLTIYDGRTSSGITHRVPLTSFSSIVVNGNDGSDWIVARPGLASKAITLNGGQGSDFLEGGDGVETLNAGGDNDQVYGELGNDVVNLGSGNDSVLWFAGDGNDVVDGRAGIDTVLGDGTNTASLEVFVVSAVGNDMLLDYVNPFGTQSVRYTDMETVDLTMGLRQDAVTVRDPRPPSLQNLRVDFGGADGRRDRLSIGTFDAGTADNITVTGSAGSVHVAGLNVTFDAFVEPIDELRIAPAANDTLDTSGLVPGTVTLMTT